MKIFPIQLCFVCLALCAKAQPEAPNAAPVPPYPPLPSSPVAIFRMLLATNEVGRTQWIAKWKPAQRDYLENKVAEFIKLSASERELRLQTLELRWYLPKLMNMTSAERNARLAQMPERERNLLAPKLQTWDIQLPQTKQDLLDYHEAIGILMFPGGGAASENVLRGLPSERQMELQKQFEHLNQLPAERRERLLADFKLYFEFSPAEKIKALRKLSGTEQARLQQTIAPFEILPPPVRQQALDGLKKFSGLSAADRAAFLQSAERWQKMSEVEREKWRLKAAQFQKARALLPPPPMPPAASQSRATALVGTN